MAEERIKEVGEDVLEFEPHVALFSGKKGMNAIIELINKGFNYLNENGLLVIEHDESQKEAIEELILKNKYSRFEFCKDQFDQYRFVKIYK